MVLVFARLSKNVTHANNEGYLYLKMWYFLRASLSRMNKKEGFVSFDYFALPLTQLPKAIKGKKSSKATRAAQDQLDDLKPIGAKIFTDFCFCVCVSACLCV